jgi:hypothetical protein
VSVDLESILAAVAAIGCLALSFLGFFIALDALDADNRVGAAFYGFISVALFVVGAILWRAW